MKRLLSLIAIVAFTGGCLSQIPGYDAKKWEKKKAKGEKLRVSLASASKSELGSFETGHDPALEKVLGTKSCDDFTLNAPKARKFFKLAKIEDDDASKLFYTKSPCFVQTTAKVGRKSVTIKIDSGYFGTLTLENGTKYNLGCGSACQKAVKN